MSSQFWYRWLVVVTIGVILFSMGFIFLPDAIQSLYNLILFGSTDGGPLMSDEAKRYLMLLYGVLGAVMIGWMVMVLALLTSDFQHGKRRAWNTLTLSITIWYLVDSSFSVYAGFIPNAIFNTFFLMLFVLPLAATYKYFHAESPV